MPLNSAKRENLALRRKVVARLLDCGICDSALQRALEIGSASERNDLKHLGGKEKFAIFSIPEKERRKIALNRAIVAYVNLRKDVRPSTRVDSLFLEALERFLDIRKLRTQADGIAAVIQHMVQPVDGEFTKYRKLLHAVFSDFTPSVDGGEVFTSFLSWLYMQPSIDIENGDDLLKLMARQALDENDYLSRMPLDETAEKYIEKVLRTLPIQDEGIIRRRFGLGEEAMNYKEIDEALPNAKPGTAKRLESHALRLLRHPSRSKVLRQFVDAPQTVAKRFIEANAPQPEPEVVERSHEELLAKPMEELDISVRAANALKNANIRTVGDIVKMDPREIMALKGFGRRHMAELRAVIEDLGLTLYQPQFITQPN